VHSNPLEAYLLAIPNTSHELSVRSHVAQYLSDAHFGSTAIAMQLYVRRVSYAVSNQEKVG
jgi:hypothetical protein